MGNLIVPDEIGGKIITPGSDWGPKGLTLEYRHGGMIVAKWHAHTCWASRGESGYSPSMWLIFDLGDLDKNSSEICAIRVGRKRAQSFHEATLVCHNPKMALYWQDRCTCGLTRGDHPDGKCEYRKGCTFEFEDK